MVLLPRWTSCNAAAAAASLFYYCCLVVLFILIIVGSSSAFSPTTTTSTISQTPVVICPGFGNDSIDYYEPLQQSPDKGMVAALVKRGFDSNLITSVPVSRYDWFRVAGGLLDVPHFYTNTAKPTGRGYGWYINRFHDTVDEMYERSGRQRVLVIGHSAGGWLARAGMGDGIWREGAGGGAAAAAAGEEDEITRTSDRIACLTTIGAIHQPPVNLNSCVTRGALATTNTMYPGAYLKNDGIGYVSVGGDAIVGNKDNNNKENAPSSSHRTESAAVDQTYERRGEGSASRVASTSYEAVCGTGDGVTGDGVVPLEWTQLDGAKQIQLDGVLHSINEAGTTIPTDKWYGGDPIIDQWLPIALQEAGINVAATGMKSNTNPLESLQNWASGVLQQ